MSEYKNVTNILTIGYYKLLQLCARVDRVEKSSYYDFLATSRQTTTRFAFKVFPITLMGSQELNEYEQSIRANRNSAPQLRINVLLMFVEEETGKVYVQKLLNWRYGQSYVSDVTKEELHELNEGYAPLLFAELDEVIQVLPQPMWSFKKTITIKDDNFIQAEIVYFRRFREDYRMKETPELNEIEKFYRYVNGIPEVEYPKDRLDEMIMEGIGHAYDQLDVRTSLFILNTELRDLQVLLNHKIENIRFLFVPQTNIASAFLHSHSDGVLPQLPLSIAYQPLSGRSQKIPIVHGFEFECNPEDISAAEGLIDSYIPLEKFLIR